MCGEEEKQLSSHKETTELRAETSALTSLETEKRKSILINTWHERVKEKVTKHKRQ